MTDANVVRPEGQRLTKRQRRLLRQQQFAEERQRAAHRGRKIFGWVCLIVLGTVATATLIWPPTTGTGKKTGSTGTVKSATVGKTVPPIGAGDWTKGKVDATVTLIEYGDFQCPACGVYYPMVRQITEEYGDRILFAFREYPLGTIHPYGNLAALAAESAGLQGKFWEMYDKLYENQSSWSKGGDVKGTFASYAEAIGINASQWKDGIDSSAVKSKIKADVASGDAGGVDGTPSFYLNNIKLENPRDVGGFKKALDAALAS